MWGCDNNKTSPLQSPIPPAHDPRPWHQPLTRLSLTPCISCLAPWYHHHHSNTPLSHSTISLPLPTPRLAETLQQSLAVDQELSALVVREFRAQGATLEVYYKATTARMLRVATNGAFESLGTLLRVCEELDVGVLAAEEDEE